MAVTQSDATNGDATVAESTDLGLSMASSSTESSL
jgi:hypothetical protein